MGETTEQQGHHSTVHRVSVRPPRHKCMQFCSTLLPICEEEPSYSIHAFWWHVPSLSRCILRVLAVTESQEAQELLDEIQQQLIVFVLSGSAIVITTVATVSAFLADGWSTESVSSVVRTARTRQENQKKERTELAYYSRIHDEVTISDTFPATVQGLDEGEYLTENTIPEDDQEDET